MLRIYKNEKNKYEIQFVNVNNFYKVLNTIKMNKGFFYNPDKKIWIGEIYSLIPLVDDIKNKVKESIEFVNFDYNKDSDIKPERKLIDLNFNYSLLKVPPLTGKHPYENFQVDDITEAIKWNRFAFFSKSGTGKSYLIINVLNHLIYHKKIDKVVFVLPSEGIYNMYKEIFKFKKFKLDEDEIYTVDTKNRKPFKDNIKVVLMTYRNFIMLSDDGYKECNNGKKIKRYRTDQIKELKNWDNNRCIICDESHNFKSFKSKINKTLQLYKKYFDYRYIMTGTPHPNIITELFTQISFLDDTLLKMNYYQFVNWIANTGNRFSSLAINYIYKDKEKEFLDKIKSYYVRRLDEVLDLPELTIRPIYVKMSDIHTEIYKEVSLSLLERLKEKTDSISGFQMISTLPFLRISLENPLSLKKHFIDNNKILKLLDKFKFDKDFKKYEILKERVEDHLDNNEKFVIFSGHPEIINLLGEKFKKHKPLILHGQIDTEGVEKNKYRAEIISKFRNNKKCNLLIANQFVMQTSITILECVNIDYIDRDYNLTVWLQSQKRFHRAGQTRNVLISPYIYDNTIENKIHEALEAKEELNKKLLKKNNMGLDDLRNFLTGK